MIWVSNSSSMEEPYMDVQKRPWVSTFAPHMCWTFFKELVGRFWGKLWALTISHGFSTWP
jgi:hypothetical protein